jgi:hypothetical protein
VAHICNLSYLVGWDGEDCGLRPAWANSSQDSIFKITRTKMDWRCGSSSRVPALQAKRVQTPQNSLWHVLFLFPFSMLLLQALYSHLNNCKSPCNNDNGKQLLISCHMAGTMLKALHAQHIYKGGIWGHLHPSTQLVNKKATTQSQARDYLYPVLDSCLSPSQVSLHTFVYAAAGMLFQTLNWL